MPYSVEIEVAPFTYISLSGTHGYGLFAEKKFNNGDIIIDYNPFFELFYKIRYDELTSVQCCKNWLKPLDVDHCLTSDITCKFHYMNHSRNPNCTWHVPDLVVVANKDIQKHEELFIDYRLEYRPNRLKFPDWI